MIGERGVAQAAQILREGGIVAIPTETVYGLAANALNLRAVTRVFEVKNRPFFDPLICHFPSLDAIRSLIPDLTEDQSRLLQLFSPGPLTLLVPRPAAIPELVTSGSDKVAVRIPAHPLTLELLNRLDFPLAAPSANPFGYISPTRASHVRDQLGEKVDFILDGGPCAVGVESTVVEVEGGYGRILRPGGITLEQLQEAMPHLSWGYVTHEGKSKAPGQLESHYAPHKRFLLVDKPDEETEETASDSVFIGFDQPSSLPYATQYLLSPEGNLGAAAALLFEALHRADVGPHRAIVAQRVPEQGLGRAINDRLRRAAAKRS